MIVTAKTAGFCFGVQRAVDETVKQAQAGNGKVYTYGPIVHNETVTSELEALGVQVLNSEKEMENAAVSADDHRGDDGNDSKRSKIDEAVDAATVIIRAHGVTRALQEKLENAGFNVVDATCPFVKKIHRIVEKHSAEGETVIVLGDPNHPEVQGITGWCRGPVHVVESLEGFEALGIPEEQKICVVAQTTFNYEKFKNVVEKIVDMGYNAIIADTVCNATQERQAEAAEIASEADLMLVIGSPSSSNSRKLYEISRKHCNYTYFIQSVCDVQPKWFEGVKCVGITAGASTPKNIIKEVQTMSESFEQLLNESFKTIRNGEVVKGTVIAVKDDEIELNIGYKHDGVIKKNEFTNDSAADLHELVKVGDEIEAKIVKVNDGDGLVQLSTRRVRTEKTSKVLEEAFEAKSVITAAVDEVVKGGLSCTVDEVKVFIPASLVSDVFEKDLSKYEGQTIEFILTEYNPKKHRVIGDRKQLIKTAKEEALNALLSKVQVGDVVEGTVKNITDFGVFIDLGGADGLLHISEMSWGRIESPKKVFKTGDTVTAFIKSIDGTKIALSKKFPNENPWADAETRFAVGNVVTGTVARLTDFGAFVELAKGVDGLLHVSQIKRERVEKPADVLTQGEEITAKIVDLDLDNKKISLSMKALLPKPERERKPRPERANKKEESNVDEAYVDIDAYIAKMAAEDAKKEAEAAEEVTE